MPQQTHDTLFGQSPSFEQIGRDYAAKVQAAIQQDARRNLEYVRKAQLMESVQPAALRGTAVVAAIKETARALDRDWKVGDRGLTRDEKRQILLHVGVALGLPEPGDFIEITEGLSNDAYMQLVTHISTIIRQSQKK